MKIVCYPDHHPHHDKHKHDMVWIPHSHLSIRLEEDK